MTKYIVKGRDIDGAVYWTGYGWAGEKSEAAVVDEAEADQVIKRREYRNKFVHIDSVIGRLTKVEV